MICCEAVDLDLGREGWFVVGLSSCQARFYVPFTDDAF
jgi:hypothetical protein